MSHIYFNSSNVALFEHRFLQQRKALIEYCGNPSLRHLKALIQNDTGNDTHVTPGMSPHLTSRDYEHTLNVFWRISCLMLLLSTMVVILYFKKRRASSTTSQDNDQVSEEIHLIYVMATFSSLLGV